MQRSTKRLRVIFLSLLFSLPSSLLGGVHETIPAAHWINPYIQLWVVKGYFPQKFLTYRPISRGDVANEIIRLKDDPVFKDTATPEDRAIFQKFQEEFKIEIDFLTGPQRENEANFSIYYDNRTYLGRVGRNRSKLNGPVEWTITSKLGVFFNFTVDQNLVDDSLYIGNNFENLRAYTEQAYFRYQGKYLDLKFGRDYLRWGPGISGSLLLSDASRSFDQILFTLHSGKLQFQSAAIFLDQYNGKIRFLSAHRLSYRLFKNFDLSIAEAMLYGNTSGAIDLRYHNPFNIFHEVHLNNKGEGNELGTIDFQWFIDQRYRVFGELLIDDIQVEKKVQQDLEPNEIGFLVGGEGIGLFNPKLDLHLEYVQIRNRTYNTRDVRNYLRYLHRRVPIGYFQGNDFDRWQIGASYWWNSSVLTQFQLIYLRQGEGRIEKIFDEPWRAYTVSEGYSESFPTGVVEKTFNPHIKISYNPRSLYYFSLEGDYFYHQNYQNIPGKNKSEWEIKLSLFLQPRWHWGLD
jgi:hypothetical protein